MGWQDRGEKNEEGKGKGGEERRNGSDSGTEDSLTAQTPAPSGFSGQAGARAKLRAWRLRAARFLTAILHSPFSPMSNLWFEGEWCQGGGRGSSFITCSAPKHGGESHPPRFGRLAGQNPGQAHIHT